MGAPLVTVFDGTDLVFGLASFGDCGKNDKPFVYTRISLFIEWTLATVCAYSDDKKLSFGTCPGPAPTPPDATPAPTPATVDPTTAFFSIISDTETGAGTYRCGGALVHDDIVVTSAECIKQSKFNKDSFYVRVGYTNDNVSAAISNITAAAAYVAIGVPKQENIPNDIAIIKLATPVSGIAFPVSSP
jgi:secreted trypsin-like serine protease